jgi:pimeloyl-ACP methyl ester carboxylesterase
MKTSTYRVTVGDLGLVEVTATDRGQGRAVLLLHGGAGPQSVNGFADLLASAESLRVITPIHPGFDGTPRPEGLTTIGALAALYTALLDELGLADVTVIGNSIGGWIAAELALRHSPRVRDLVLVDAVGIEVPGHPIADFFALTLADVARLSYHDPDRFRIDPSTMTPAQQATMAGNRAALAVYGGTSSMGDPTLSARLSDIDRPVLVLWGDSDQIVDPDYGRAFARAIPAARFELLTDTGHVPQIETPDQLRAAIAAFLNPS